MQLPNFFAKKSIEEIDSVSSKTLNLVRKVLHQIFISFKWFINGNIFTQCCVVHLDLNTNAQQIMLVWSLGIDVINRAHKANKCQIISGLVNFCAIRNAAEELFSVVLHISSAEGYLNAMAGWISYFLFLLVKSKVIC